MWYMEEGNRAHTQEGRRVQVVQSIAGFHIDDLYVRLAIRECAMSCGWYSPRPLWTDPLPPHLAGIEQGLGTTPLEDDVLRSNREFQGHSYK